MHPHTFFNICVCRSTRKCGTCIWCNGRPAPAPKAPARCTWGARAWGFGMSVCVATPCSSWTSPARTRRGAGAAWSTRGQPRRRCSEGAARQSRRGAASAAKRRQAGTPTPTHPSGPRAMVQMGHAGSWGCRGAACKRNSRAPGRPARATPTTGAPSAAPQLGPAARATGKGGRPGGGAAPRKPRRDRRGVA